MTIMLLTASVLVLSAFSLLGGCRADQEAGKMRYETAIERDARDIPLRYARRFTLTKLGRSTLIGIRKPEGAKRGVFFRYLLVPKGEKVPQGYSDALVVRTPVRKVTGTQGLQIAMLDQLGEIGSIVGISRKAGTGNPLIQERFAEGRMQETGMSSNMNMEVMVNLHPDIAFVNASGSVNDVHEKLLAMGVKPGLVCMHIEEEPLGVLEWIRFFGAFYGKDAEAEAFFNQAAERYEKVAALVRAKKGRRPGVMVGHSVRGIWSTHGSSAWFVRLLHDAGSRYVLEDSTEYEENPVSLEKALHVGTTAEYWINPRYDAQRMEELLGDDPRYRYFRSVRTGRVYNNNALVFSNGRSQFWENGMMEPDIVLRDLVKVFHPELLPDYRPKYYHPLR